MKRPVLTPLVQGWLNDGELRGDDGGHGRTTLAALAHAIGWKAATLTQRLNGKRGMDYHEAVQIAHAFERPVKDLVESGPVLSHLRHKTPKGTPPNGDDTQARIQQVRRTLSSARRLAHALDCAIEDAITATEGGTPPAGRPRHRANAGGRH